MSEAVTKIPEWATGLVVESFTAETLKLRYTKQLPAHISLNTNTRNSSVHIYAEYGSGRNSEKVTFTTFVDLAGFTPARLDEFMERLVIGLKLCTPEIRAGLGPNKSDEDGDTSDMKRY
jgi:hypothetical protein